MANYSFKCPHCGEMNDVSGNDVTVECGTASGSFTCKKCNEEVRAEQPYWRCLGLEKAPPARGEDQQRVR